MDHSVFTGDDLEEISARGMTPEEVLSQIRRFEKGIPFVKIVKPCTVNDGISILDSMDIENYVQVFDAAQKSGRCMKFVPASGAATRMFKLLLGTHNDLTDESEPQNITGDDAIDEKLLSFIQKIDKYAFYDDLKQKMKENGEDLDVAIRSGHIKTILEYLLFEKGLNLSDIPKGLIPFHRYDDHSRTPFEEHLVEAFNYTGDKDGKTRIHFTVSPQHEKKIKEFINNVLHIYERDGAEYNIGFSFQKPSTDTIAVDLNNLPFRNDDGSLLFRPGGHGALIENLSDLKGDIIFIKNIDNVVTDRFKDLTYTYKKALGGLLITLQKKIFGYIDLLMLGRADTDMVEDIFSFLHKRLSIIPPENLSGSTMNEKRKYLVRILNRPLRVCGMVKNTGEPGGGPFWVEQAGKGVSIQIIESSQVDLNNDQQKKVFKSATHFNPVDLVCGVRDYDGRPFDLKKYIDGEAGFISLKSKSGRELKAMELPGLWNGSMACWNTVFVEVPAATFSPVKTVFDLMKDDHQLI